MKYNFLNRLMPSEIIIERVYYFKTMFRTFSRKLHNTTLDSKLELQCELLIGNFVENHHKDTLKYLKKQKFETSEELIFNIMNDVSLPKVIPLNEYNTFFESKNIDIIDEPNIDSYNNTIDFAYDTAKYTYALCQFGLWSIKILMKLLGDSYDIMNAINLNKALNLLYDLSDESLKNMMMFSLYMDNNNTKITEIKKLIAKNYLVCEEKNVSFQLMKYLTVGFNVPNMYYSATPDALLSEIKSKLNQD